MATPAASAPAAGGGVQDAEPHRTGVQDVPCVDRQQGRAGPEERCTEIQDHERQDHLLCPHEARAGQQRFQRSSSPPFLLQRRPDEHKRHEHRAPRQSIDRIAQRRAHYGQRNARQRRPNNRRDVPLRVVEGDGRAEIFLVHQVGHDRLASGRFSRAGERE